MSLIIFSHTDYSYLWPLIEECIIKIKKLELVFVCNKTDINKPNGFTEYIEYDDKLCYAERWTKDILPYIDKKYILVVHDVQLVVNCDTNFIHKIMQIMLENRIDRCSLNVFNGENIIENYNIKLCHLNSAHGNTLTPYDVCPAIWKTDSLKELFDIFPNETYRTSELNDNLQMFCRNNLRCFGLQKTNEKIYYCLGRPYLEYFKVLFITIKNDMLFPVEVYMDMKNEFLYFLQKYKLTEKINYNYNCSFIVNNFKPI